MLRQRATALLSPLSIRHFRRLWLADMVSLLGDWAGRLALAVLVLERTGSPAWAAAVTAVSLAGFVGIGQVLATLADRHGRVAVMLAADVARAALFAAMLLPLPVGCAARAGVPRRARHAAVRGGALGGPPRPRARGPLRRGARAGGHLGAVVARDRLRARRPAPHGGRARGGAGHQLGQLPRVGGPAPRAPPHRRRRTGRGAGHRRSVARRRRRVALPRSAGPPRPRDRRRHRRARHRRRGARRALRRRGRHAATARSGCSPPPSRSAPSSAPPPSRAAAATTTALLRNAAWCGAVTSAAAAPLFWLEASGAFAFVAFAIAGGMFAVSIPTNTVIGMRLSRDTRASAMGIAVGVLMGSQALGAALGGLVASADRVGAGHRRGPRRCARSSASGRR